MFIQTSNKLCLAILILLSIHHTRSNQGSTFHDSKPEQNISCIGLFQHSDSMLNGLTWANWGSRPYEYSWASRIANVNNKRIIDLGTGLPSQHSWYNFVVKTLKPAFYVGIDIDERMDHEQIETNKYALKKMSMTNIAYPSEYFDVAYCISTFEHLTYKDFMISIGEIHRILKNDGLLIITLDESWDKDVTQNYNNSWNVLERDLVQLGLHNNQSYSFCLVDFLLLIKEKFVCLKDAEINHQNKTIRTSNSIIYQKNNRDQNVLHNPLYNSCVSYAILKKVTNVQ